MYCKKKVFAASIVAAKSSGKMLVYGSSAIGIIARNEDEAMGIALRKAHKVMPTNEGWGNHACDVYELPREWLSLAYPELATGGVDEAIH